VTTPWIIAFSVLSTVVVLLGFLVLGTLRRVLPMLADAEAAISIASRNARLGGLPEGVVVPPFVETTLDGGTFTDSDLRGSLSAVLFVGAGCTACASLVADIESNSVPDHLGARLVVVSDEDEAHRFTDAQVTAVVQHKRSLARTFESDRTPHVFVVGPDGRIVGRGWPNDWSGIAELVAHGRKEDGSRDEVGAAIA
jgi:hypothetical protein